MERKRTGGSEALPVDANGVAPERNHRYIDLPFLKSLQDVSDSNSIFVRDPALSGPGLKLESPNHELPFLSREEFGCSGTVW